MGSIRSEPAKPSAIWGMSAYIAMLFNDPGGQRVLAAAIGLLVIGILVMRSMIRRSLS